MVEIVYEDRTGTYDLYVDGVGITFSFTTYREAFNFAVQEYGEESVME